MPAVQDVLRSQANRGDAVPTRKLSDQEVSARMIITPARPSLVQVYEPAQSQLQEEVILEEFVLDGGETETRDPRSATAAFRFLPLTLEQQQKLDDARRQRLARAGDGDAALALTEGQEGVATPETHDEMKMGRTRQRELQAAEEDAAEGGDGEPTNRRPKRRSEHETNRETNRESGGAIRGGTAGAEIERGGEEERSVPRREPRREPKPAPKEAPKEAPKRASTSSTKRGKK
jgi:hypothetical protein